MGVSLHTVHRWRSGARAGVRRGSRQRGVARKIYELRIKAGLTQQELASRVGTTKSAISRLEDADYEGHSLSMMKRIAEALGKRVEIRFLPAKKLKTA
ncbi:MAG: XRE family transcriptional regulator [Bryobacterales bacterium]|nr:XRE family transcriptional regulator [Bryobacterales bacterium]